MAVKLTMKQFREHGLAVDPTDPAQAVPVNTPPAQKPDDTWDPERLGAYASAELSHAAHLDAEVYCLARRSTVHVYHAGHALRLAREKLKDEAKWCEWQKRHGIPRTTAWEAIELHRRAKSEEEVAHLTPAEAKEQYGITRPKQRQPSRIANRAEAEQNTKTCTPRPGILEDPDNHGDDDEPGGAAAGGEPEPGKPQREASKEHTLAFSDRAQTAVSLLEPGKFEIRFVDSGTVYKLLIWRKQIDELYYEKIKKAMDQDDDCEPDEIPQ